MSRGIYIIGTDTDVGKTFITAVLVSLMRKSGYDTAYFKAVLSGAEKKGNKLVPGDTEFVCKASGLNEKYENLTPYIFETAVSPHLASKIEGIPIDINNIKRKFNFLKQKYDYIIAEGSGGIICPIIETNEGAYTLANLIKELGMGVLLVASAEVGTINHTVLTVEYAKNMGIEVRGIIINGYKNSISHIDNAEMIKKLTGIPILGLMPWIDEDHIKDISVSIRGISDETFEINSLINVMGEI
ncbi:MAG: dethiobiotin synthase [Bacillota bacterium]|nr:dethiobiotin synthase [Bacillota bacterium]